MMLLYSIKKWKSIMKLKTFNADGSKRKSENSYFYTKGKVVSILTKLESSSLPEKNIYYNSLLCMQVCQVYQAQENHSKSSVMQQ